MPKESNEDNLEQCAIGRELIEIGRALLATQQDIGDLQTASNRLAYLQIRVGSLIYRGKYSPTVTKSMKE